MGLNLREGAFPAPEPEYLTPTEMLDIAEGTVEIPELDLAEGTYEIPEYEPITIDSVGNVGFGTSNPNTLLQITDPSLYGFELNGVTGNPIIRTVGDNLYLKDIDFDKFMSFLEEKFPDISDKISK